MEAVPPPVAAFDFDGTLTRHDTLWLFLRHVFGLWRLLAGLVCCAPWLAAFALRLLSGGAAKERLLGHFLGGMEAARFERLGRDFAQAHAATVWRTGARQAIESHLAAGHRVVVVTASLRPWVEPFFEEWPQIAVLATEMAVDPTGRLTGRFATPNCHGSEKWRRLLALIPDVEHRRLIAYGDSAGDTALLAHAQEPHFREKFRADN